jgi:phosphomannomutase/phosphoglucomutase
MALVLDLLAASGKTLSQKVAELPPSFTTKDKISCSTEDAKKIISALESQNSNADTTDGIKIIFDERNWVMIRPSGTEPIIRIYAEAESSEKLDHLMSEHIQKIKSILSE